MSAPLFLSSGDLLADRRYDYARGLIADGDLAAAADLLAQAVERSPSFASAWFALGETRLTLGDRDGAIAAFEQARAADAQDRHGAALQLARLGAADPATAMSPDYVRTLFDQYAPRFDRALTEGLGYRGPQLLRDAVTEACRATGRDERFDRAFDLGCGTGLVAQAFRPRIDSIVGVDLSPAMIEEARRTGMYNHLHAGDMLAFLRGEHESSADLVIAADAFVYVADLGPVCREAARVLEQGGLLAFTVETHEGDGVIVGEKLRYAHGADHVRTALAAADLGEVVLRPASTRQEGGAPVPGLLVVAEQRGRPLLPLPD